MRRMMLLLVLWLVACGGANYSETIVYVTADAGHFGAVEPDASPAPPDTPVSPGDPEDAGVTTPVDAATMVDASLPDAGLDTTDANTPITIGPTDGNTDGPWGYCPSVFNVCRPYTAPAGKVYCTGPETTWLCPICDTTDAGVSIMPPPPCGASTLQMGPGVFCCEDDGGPVTKAGE